MVLYLCQSHYFHKGPGISNLESQELEEYDGETSNLTSVLTSKIETLREYGA